jgi:gluconolactonase
MRITALFLLTASASVAQTASNPAESTIDTTDFPTIGEVIRLDPAFDALVAKDAKIEVLADGFVWAEGPVWVADDTGGHVLFSDIPRNSIMKWKEGVGASLFMKPSGYTGVEDYGGEPGCNGLILDKGGHLIACEHGDRRLSILTKGGGKRTIVDNYQGKRLNSPNDVCMKSNGDLYFTDPPYGLPKRWDDPRRELDFCGVYRRGIDGTLTLLTKEMSRPNGIAFSPDEKTLYVAQSDSKAPVIEAYPVNDDGTLGDSRILFDFSDDYGKLPGSPDGLKVDSNGNLWATAPGGVSVITPDGKRLGRISTTQRTANCGWGGDGSVLYMTADMYLCRIQTKVKGAGW